MNLKLTLFSLLFLLIAPSIANKLYAQSEPVVGELNIEIIDESIVIRYAIENYQKEDLFTVWLLVTDSVNNKIIATSVTGDLGNEIKGGEGKEIKWNIIKDSIILSENIFFEIKAERENPPEIIAEIEPEKTNIEDPVEITKEKSIGKREVNIVKHIAMSVAFPGWGTSVISQKKGYLFMGVAGYGCLATSYLYYGKAVEAYDVYVEATDASASENEKLINEALKYANYSRIFAYTGLAIWVADLVLVTVKANNRNNILASELNRIELNSSFSMLDNSPMVGLTYRF